MAGTSLEGHKGGLSQAFAAISTLGSWVRVAIVRVQTLAYETSHVCQPVDLFHANCELQCHFHSLPKVWGLVNKSSSLLDGNLQASVVPPS